MASQLAVEEMLLAAATDPEAMIGFCEGGFPITGDACQFCGATWKDKCGRRDRAERRLNITEPRSTEP